jgi:hypothetical protein
MKGTQRRMICPSCSKVFFAWRPDDLPGAPVKCYFCGKSFEDEAARRKPVAPPPAPATSTATPAAADPVPSPPAAAPADPGSPASPAVPASTDPAVH